MGKYTRGLLAVILAVVLVLPAAAFAMLPEANARSSTGMDGPTVTGKIVDPNTSENWTYWAAGSDGSGKITTQNVGRIWTDKTVEAGEESDFVTTLSAISSTSNTITTVPKPLDIVLVLDASGSMNDPMGGATRPSASMRSRLLPVRLLTKSPKKTQRSRMSPSSIRSPL